MYKFPLKNGFAYLEFIVHTSRRWPKPLPLQAKIDTGARYLMIPDRLKKSFHHKKTGQTKSFKSASGDNLTSTEVIITVNIKEIGLHQLKAFFYSGERILLGIEPLTQLGKACFDKRYLYLYL